MSADKPSAKSGDNSLLEGFERCRGHLRGVAYRLLGSLAEADDAIQECWLRASRSDSGGVENLQAWLTTIVARICLNMLRRRNSRHEEALEAHTEAPTPAGEKSVDPEQETLMAESVGLAVLVLLDRLAPLERVAFVLHDVFALPFEDIAPIVGRSPVAARQLASRARRRVRRPAMGSRTELSKQGAKQGAEQRAVVERFLIALRAGDANGVLAVLDPDVVRRADLAATPAGATTEMRGAASVMNEALKHTDLARFAQAALVNGSAGIIVAPRGRLRVVISCKVRDGKIREMDVMADPMHIRKLDLAAFPD
jgi:RNA polymerase sigma factor (sigma-70 family)